MTLTSSLELAIHRNGTKRFIDADPTLITLSPANQTAIVDGTRKSIGPSVVRNPQKFKIIYAGDTGIVREISDGQAGVRRFDFIIVGEHDAIVEVGDSFTLGQNKYVVEYVFPFNDYEVKAGGVSHGNQPT
jgi:hypothetical protein